MRPPADQVIVIDDDTSDYGSLAEELTGTFSTLPDDNSPRNDNYSYATDFDFEIFPEPIHLHSSTTAIDPESRYRLYLDKILEVFPDICLDHVRLLYDARRQISQEQQLLHEFDEDVSQSIIIQILDAGKYPKEKDRKKKLKRKRSGGGGEEAEWTAPDRPMNSLLYGYQVHHILQKEFVNIPQRYLDAKLKELRFLYPTYMALELIERTYNETLDPPYQRLKTPRKPRIHGVANIKLTDYDQAELGRELHAVKKEQEKQEAQRREKQAATDSDLALHQQCLESGDMIECQCCFTDTPTPKSTHCSGDDMHFFCLDCARSNANSQIELSRFILTCMDGSGCKAEFARDQKHRFLDMKTIHLLDRLQQQAELRTADLANLEKCPFCDYAAICPPVETDKEFRCRMPDCERVSCRLCKLDSHIPLTCEEYRKENGLSERHVLEEAMTKALVRPCPKCNVPILKDGGCNKLVCSQCRCAVCDYCGKDITKSGYSHFSGAGRNGPGCPPNDDTDRRNAIRVDEAGKEAMMKIRLENPNLSEDDLKIKFSKEVQTGTDLSRSPADIGGGIGGGIGDGLGGNLEPPLPHNGYQANFDELRRQTELIRQRTREMGRMLEEQNRQKLADLLEKMRRKSAEDLEREGIRLAQKFRHGHHGAHQANEALTNAGTQEGRTHTPLPTLQEYPGYHAGNIAPAALNFPAPAPPAGPYYPNQENLHPGIGMGVPMYQWNPYQYTWNAWPQHPQFAQPIQQQQQQQQQQPDVAGGYNNTIYQTWDNTAFLPPGNPTTRR